MKFLVIEPFKKPYVKDAELTLETIKNIVGNSPTMIGPIENSRCVIISNKNRPVDRPLNPLSEQAYIPNNVCWTLLVCAISDYDESFLDLNQKEIEYYSKRFANLKYPIS